MIRILLSARDPGGAGNIIALARYFSRLSKFEVLIAGSGVAYNILGKAGENPINFVFSNNQDHLKPDQDPKPLLREAKRLLEQKKPDVVLTSLSSFGMGIDEALLATATVPTFAIQDFWGDVNLALGIPANIYFVLDEYAVKLSEKRWGVKAIAVGSPKYSFYKELDIIRMRKEARLAINANDDDSIVGWFGQSPDIPGHESVYMELLKAITRIANQPRLIIRDHPKFLEACKEHRNAARELGLCVKDVTRCGNSEEWLVACDSVVTPFSLCGLDHAYLSAFSPKPIGHVLYLMTNQLIRDFSDQVCGMVNFPIVDKGIGKLITRADEVADALNWKQTQKSSDLYFNNSKKLSGGDPLSIISDYILRVV